MHEAIKAQKEKVCGIEAQTIPAGVDISVTSVLEKIPIKTDVATETLVLIPGDL